MVVMKPNNDDGVIVLKSANYKRKKNFNILNNKIILK